MNTQLKMSRLFIGAILFLSGSISLTGLVAPLRAATIVVTTTLDENDGSCSDGDCSLRDALATAVSGDTISIPAGSYVLSQGELEVTKTVTLLGGTPAPILDGNASSRVFQVPYNVSLTLNHFIVTNGSSVDGGGIAVTGGELILIDSEVRENSASNNGGGIFLGNGTVILTSGKISQNTAAFSGGGVYNMDGMLVQSGGTIEGNSAAAGGGVYVNLSEATYTLNDGLLQQNSSTALESGGGGVYVAQGTVTMNGGQIAENSGVRGGGIESANGEIFLNEGIIRGNEAQYGGGVYLSFPDAFLTQNGGEISQNVSNATDFGGGGVHGFQGSMALTGGRVSQNTAVANGGGINIRFGELTITGGEIVQNQAGGQGGGIFADFSTLSITDLQVGNNSAATGGGLYLNTFANLELAETAVYSNTATLNGGGLVLKGNSLLTNATVSNNQAQGNGGGLWLEAGSIILNSVTLSENTAVNGGGLFNNSAAANLHNSLLAENVAVSGPNCGGTVFTSDGYNFIQDEADCVLDGDATGNILGQDPLLEPLTLNNGSTYIYPLDAASPAVDAGDPLDCPSNDQQGRPRPLDGNMNGTAVCDIGAFEYGIPVRIGDVIVTEGDSGSTMANFPVTLDFAAPVTVTVAYASSQQSAVAALDYEDVFGTLTFSPGQTEQTIAVPVLGDLLDEVDETFVVTLNNPTNAYLAKSQAIGIILDNDPLPRLSINDVTITEGDGGSKTASLSVTLSAPSGKTVQVSYATANGAATAGTDYTAVSDTLTFTPGQTSKSISVSVLGDLLDEENETFSVNLSSLQNAMLSKGQGIGTIQDNDPLPVLTISNVTITETDRAPQTMLFTVNLSAVSGKTVSVNYATMDQTAVAGRDYTAKSGTLTFTPGQTSKTISITILTDVIAEPTETFAVKLSAAVNATLGVSQGIGTILDNDPAGPTTTSYTLYLPVVIRP